MTSHPYYDTILLLPWCFLPPASIALQFRQFALLLQAPPLLPIGSPKASFQPFFLFATTRSHSDSQIAPLPWFLGCSACSLLIYSSNYCKHVALCCVSLYSVVSQSLSCSSIMISVAWVRAWA